MMISLPADRESCPPPCFSWDHHQILSFTNIFKTETDSRYKSIQQGSLFSRTVDIRKNLLLNKLNSLRLTKDSKDQVCNMFWCSKIKEDFKGLVSQLNQDRSFASRSRYSGASLTNFFSCFPRTSP